MRITSLIWVKIITSINAIITVYSSIKFMCGLSKIKVNINTDTCNYTHKGNLQFDGCGLMWDLKIKVFPLNVETIILMLNYTCKKKRQLNCM